MRGETFWVLFTRASRPRGHPYQHPALVPTMDETARASRPAATTCGLAWDACAANEQAARLRRSIVL